MDKLDYLIIALDTPEKLAEVKALPNCNQYTEYGQTTSLYGILGDTHWLRGRQFESNDRMFIPSIHDIPKVKLLHSLGLSKAEIKELLNE